MQGETTTTIINGKVVTLAQSERDGTRYSVLADGRRIGWARYSNVWETWDFYRHNPGMGQARLIGSNPCLKAAIAEGLVTIAAGEVGK